MAKGDAELAVWNALNSRQQIYLRSIYGADQAVEAARRADQAEGRWGDRRPASEWRQIDAHHEPASPREMVGTTDLQYQWARYGHHDQGTGSTLKYLWEQDLISTGQRRTLFGVMHTVAMTRRGRAVVRASFGITSAPPVPTHLLDERPVEVLAKLATQPRLSWLSSWTIEHVLMTHEPPLAEGRQGNWRATDAGRAHYREYYRAYLTAYPWMALPVPEGEAPPWPPAADQQLNDLDSACHQVLRLRADIERQAAEVSTERETLAKGPSSRHQGFAPAAALADEQHRLRCDQVDARAELLNRHREQVEPLLPQAVARYAAAAVAALAAFVDGSDVVAAVEAARQPDPAGALPAPAATGLAAFDAETAQLHALCRAKPRAPRRGAKAKALTGALAFHVPEEMYGTPLEAPWALAARISSQLRDGYLLRLRDRAHQPVPVPAPRKRRSPELLDGPALKLLVGLVDPDQAASRQGVRYWATRSGTADRLTDRHDGLMPNQQLGITRSRKAPDVLVARGLAERIDINDLRRLDSFTPVPAEPLYLLAGTDAGRAHLAEHNQEYRELFPQIELPDLAEESP